MLCGHGRLWVVGTDTHQIAEFFDRECCAAVDPGASLLAGSAGVTAVLVNSLASEGEGLAGAAVLELGSGDGSLSRELVARGAARVDGLDLSPMSVEYATSAADRAGLSERLGYQVGDGALVALEASDVVVSQKVFCCYPRADQLLANTLPAARSIYALVLPESRGPAGLVSRILVAVENGWRRLRRDSFRAYVHDVREVDAVIRAAGFRPAPARRHWLWLVMVYSRS
jgi:SAM-dependent methyltransferase